MADDAQAAAMRAVVESYFRFVDARSPDLMNVFTDDVEVYYPKFGVARGKAAFGELGAGMASLIASMRHPIELMTFYPSGNSMIVEGLTQGVDHQGRSWAGGESMGGRFCNVFTFRGDLIERLFIYLDPDRLGDDEDRILWGKEGRSW